MTYILSQNVGSPNDSMISTEDESPVSLLSLETLASPPFGAGLHFIFPRGRKTFDSWEVSELTA